MIKISLSRPQRGPSGQRARRHLVVSCPLEDVQDVSAILYREVLRPNGASIAVPRRDRRRSQATFALSLRHLPRLRLTLPAADISPGLDAKLLKEARAAYEAIPVPQGLKIPGMARGEALRGHQLIAVDRIEKDWATGNSVHFLDDEMGVGKTPCALSIVARAERSARRSGRDFSALVVAPNNIKYLAWKADANKFFPRMQVRVIDAEVQSPAERERIVREKATLTIVNYESLWRLRSLSEHVYDVFVADEYHRVKNPDAAQSRGFQSIQFVNGLFMSGTPILNGRVEERWTALNRAWPDHFPDYGHFIAYHKVRTRNDRVTAYRNLPELKEWTSPHETRRRKDQVLRDLPEKVYQRITVGMSAEQRRIYQRIVDEMLLELVDPDTGETRAVPVVSVLAQVTRLKQACWSPELFQGSPRSSKVEECKRIVEELIANGEKAIIFSQWARATRILRRELEQAGYRVAYVDGKVPMRERTRAVQSFQSDDDVKVFIGTIGSCREGITLTAGSYVIFTDKGWTPAENEQAAARAHRIGQTRTVNIIEIFAADTIESDIEDMLQQKQNIFNALVEEDAGVRATRFELSDIRALLEGGAPRSGREDFA